MKRLANQNCCRNWLNDQSSNYTSIFLGHSIPLTVFCYGSPATQITCRVFLVASQNICFLFLQKDPFVWLRLQDWGAICRVYATCFRTAKGNLRRGVKLKRRKAYYCRPKRDVSSCCYAKPMVSWSAYF